MLTPRDIAILNLTTSAQRDQRDQLIEECERQFDFAITFARETRSWPAEVHSLKDGMTTAVVDATIEKYRAAGWTVVQPRDHSYRALIHRPFPDATTVQVDGQPATGLTETLVDSGDPAAESSLSLVAAITAWAIDTGRLPLAHLCTAARREAWALDRIIAAISAIDTSRPDGGIAKSISL
jgi:hypothetical protein